jgi:hypothetical protein
MIHKGAAATADKGKLLVAVSMDDRSWSTGVRLGTVSDVYKGMSKHDRLRVEVSRPWLPCK